MNENQDKGNKRIRNDSGESSESKEDEQVERGAVVINGFNEKAQGHMKEMNPFVLTTTLANKVGEIVFAKVLNDGNLLVRCANEEQLEKALKLKEIGKCKVEYTGRVGARNGGCKGVITGVPMSINMEELKRNIKGGKVINVRRLKTTKEGMKKESETVLIESEEARVPSKVFLGFMSYPVRVYVPNPLRCYNCQRFGHIAKNCKRQRRCARCGDVHEYGKCGTGVQPKCCNCGGAHNVAYSGCEVMRREIKIQEIRVKRKITYAEAVRMSREQNNAPNDQRAIGMQEMQRRVYADRIYVWEKKLW
ncbi:uncharacterized protein LOC132385715 [Hypanus sabinus]|uniref:uncharacterized protein LOC132385715 n=1 Tax=Hypanus sabinus TaxID=79690 RepID=UPI0028C3829D|nr:uncharacterized protein LOC132385715 [Hypanus sabinus]